MNQEILNRFFFLKKIIFMAICIFSNAISIKLLAQTEWTNLVYVQAKNNLSPFALKNFSDMASIGSNENMTTLVQWYQPGQRGIWRYKVEKGKMVLDECSQSDTDGNSAHDLVDAMKWAASKFPSKKYSLVLWDHGIGILDPLWGRTNQQNTSNRISIDSEMFSNNPRIQIDGITIDSTVTFTKKIDCAFSTSERGILFNEQSRTYMTNQSLSQALHEIKTKVLKNKKIDLLGMDACLMAMVEVGYLARNYAEVLVASQEVELAHGWPYDIVTETFSAKNSSAIQIAKGIVRGYESYYKNKIPFFTQSAIDLTAMSDLKESIDNIITAFRACQKSDKVGSTDLVRKARKSCLQFSTTHYIDLHTFFVELSNLLNTTKQSSSAYNNLKNRLSTGMKVIEHTVLASATGSNLTRAKGLSIYFPVSRIDSSYPKTEFAQDCLWYEFIKELCGG